MAAIGTGQWKRLFSDGEADRIGLFALKNVNTGDTLDLLSDFTFVKRAVMLGATVNGAQAATVTAPTTVTMPAGLANDAAYMLAWGCAA